jgi:hypothetical protein
MKWMVRAILTTTLVAVATSASAQMARCSNVRVDQEHYQSLSKLMYVYVPNIDKKSGGWESFTIRLLVAANRSPMILPQGFLREKDLDKLLSSRPDITQYSLPLAKFDPKRTPGQPALGQPVKIPDGASSVTVRVTRVDPAAGVSLGSDHVFLDVCR